MRRTVLVVEKRAMMERRKKAFWSIAASAMSAKEAEDSPWPLPAKGDDSAYGHQDIEDDGSQHGQDKSAGDVHLWISGL